MAEENQTTHKRRVRYSGKYPKKFEEKYKELQPEKYKDTIEHVIKKGNTPAGMHISIMVNEILDFLKIQPGETGFDATLGYGGHTKAAVPKRAGTHLCNGCRPGGISQDKKAVRRGRFWRRYSDNTITEFLYDR